MASRGSAYSRDDLFGKEPSYAPSQSQGMSQNESKAQGDTGDLLELEHVIGYTGHYLSTLHFHPKQPNTMIYAMGACVVIQDLSDPHQQEFLRGHDEEISALATSSSGQLVASGQRGSTLHKGDEAPVIVWDLSSKRDLYQLLGLTYSVVRLAFSQDDRFLAASGENNLLYVWDMQTGEVIVGKKVSHPITVLAWGAIDYSSRRPRYSLCTASQSSVGVHTLAYDVRCMQYVIASDGMQVPASGLVRSYATGCVDPSASYLLMGTSVSDVCVFALGSRVYRASIPISSNGVVSLVGASGANGGGSCIYAGGGDGALKKIAGADTEWRLLDETMLSGKVVSLSLSPDESELLAGTSAGRIYRVRCADMSAVEVACSHIAGVADVTFGSRSDLFASLSTSGSIRVWDLSDYSLLSQTRVDGVGMSLAFACDDGEGGAGYELITGWKHGAIHSHDSRNGQPLWEIAAAHRGGVTSLALTPLYLVSGGDEGGVRVWARRSRELLIQFVEHRGAVTKVLCDLQDPVLLHSCGMDRTVFTYNLKKERRMMSHQLTRDAVGAFTGMTQRRDSELEVVTCGSDGRLLFWDIDVAEPVMSLQDPNRLRLNQIAMSPSGRFVAVCGDDHQVKVYDVQQQTLVACGYGHSASVTALEWSPDERQLLSVGRDCCVCVWNFYGAEG